MNNSNIKWKPGQASKYKKRRKGRESARRKSCSNASHSCSRWPTCSNGSISSSCRLRVIPTFNKSYREINSRIRWCLALDSLRSKTRCLRQMDMRCQMVCQTVYPTATLWWSRWWESLRLSKSNNRLLQLPRWWCSRQCKPSQCSSKYNKWSKINNNSNSNSNSTSSSKTL